MRVIFYGNAASFSGALWLDALVLAGHEIRAVYCQPPRPSRAW